MDGGQQSIRQEHPCHIAFSVGYNEPNYLSYLFKKREGLTPKEYRLQRKPQRGKVKAV